MEGWNVLEASDGREALVQALTARLSVIVTELPLPLIDGVVLCDILRRDPAGRSVVWDHEWASTGFGGDLVGSEQERECPVVLFCRRRGASAFR